MINGNGRAAPAPGRRRRIGVIGAGPGGIATAIRLKQAGYDDITLFEKSDGVGGTWHNNRYPGLACDVASHLYSFSFALNPAWSRSFAEQPEILRYMEDVVNSHDLRRHIRLSTPVTGATWDDECHCWRLTLGTGEEATVDILVSAQGMFNVLNWPKVEGMEAFEGPLFHTANWPDDLSLAGKTVAVIGTAASAVQMIPVIAKTVKELHVYQRTPNWVLPKQDEIFAEEAIGERRARPDLVRRHRLDIYRQLDAYVAWTDMTPEVEEEYRKLGEQCIEVVTDPDVRRKLTPDFNWGCTRPLMSNEYFQTYNRDNVELITDGVARVTADGVVDATGRERKADIVICATGYKTDRFASAIDIVGQGGLDIKESWKDGAHAYLGMTTPGFPNFFMIYGPNTNNGSLLFMLECQAAYIARHLEWMDARDLSWIDIKPDFEKSYNDQVQEDIDQVKVWKGGCHNYYLIDNGRNVTQYPHNMTKYKESVMAADWDNFAFGRGVSL